MARSPALNRAAPKFAISNRPREEMIFPNLQFRNGFNLLVIINYPLSINESAFQIDKPHRHNQNPVGANGHSPLLWSTDMKTAVSNSTETGFIWADFDIIGLEYKPGFLSVVLSNSTETGFIRADFGIVGLEYKLCFLSVASRNNLTSMPANLIFFVLKTSQL